MFTRSTHRGSVAPVIVVVLSGSLFTALVASDVFADPDAFYHARMALLIREQGIVRDFPWLPFTELARHYADQHFLYHLFLTPFVSFPDPLTGLKIATVVLATGFLLVFFLVLRSLHVSAALPGTLALLLISPFTFRLALAKGNAFALIFLFLVLWCLFHQRPRTLALVSFLFVWSYGGFPLAIVAAVAFLVGSLIGDALERRHHPVGILERLFPFVSERLRPSVPHALRLLAAVTIGILLGLIVNPFFPENLPFLYNQFIRIGVVNYRSVIGVGGEWYPYQPLPLLTNTIILTIPLLITLFVLAATARRQSRRSWSLCLLTALLFLLTLKSRRYIEYYVPTGMFFVLSALSDAYRPQSFGSRVRSTIQRLMGSWRSFVLSVVLAVYLFIMLPTVAIRDLVGEWRDLRTGFRTTQYRRAMAWLKRETPAGSIVVHSDWDEFPLLFYWNQHNRFIAGLDPTFLYTADRDRYWTWVKISTGEYQGSLPAGLRQLDAGYLFVDREHPAMDRLVQRDPAVERVFADDEATIYQLTLPGRDNRSEGILE